MIARTVAALRISRTSLPDDPATCPARRTSAGSGPPARAAPSPCGRLSRPPWRVVTPATTTGALFPWASRPVGNPAFRRDRTYRARRRWPFRPLEWGRSPSFAGRKFRATPYPSPYARDPAPRRCSGRRHFSSPGTGLHAIQRSPYRAGLAERALLRLPGCLGFSGMLLSPLTFIAG